MEGTTLEENLFKQWLRENHPRTLLLWAKQREDYIQKHWIRQIQEVAQGREEEALEVLRAYFNGEEVVVPAPLNETISHPLDEAIDWVRIRGERYSHTDPECVVSHFGGIEAFAQTFGVPIGDASALYWANFSQIDASLADWDVLEVTAEVVVEALEALKRKRE
jgi:hypothetical protein